MQTTHTTSDETIKEVSKILAGHFNGLYAFYCDNFFKFKQNTYTVINGQNQHPATASWFFKIINEYLKDTIDKNFEITDENGFITILNKSTGKKNIILSETALDSNFPFDPEYQFNVIKDVTIHGRDVHKTYKKIKEMFANSAKSPTIKKIGYLFAEETNFKGLDDFGVKSNGTSAILLARKLNHCVSYLNLPCDFLKNSMVKFDVKSEDFKDLLNKLFTNSNLHILDYIPKDELVQRRAFLLIEKTTNMQKNELLKCCKLSYNEKTQTLSFVPYVVLAKICAQDIRPSISTYLKSVPENAFNGNDVYAYNALTAIASNSYGQYFLNTYMPEFVGHQDFYKTMQLAFGKDSHLILDSTNYDLSAQANAPFIMKNQLDDDFNEQLKREDEIFQHDLGSLWINNEVAACYLLDRNNPLSIQNQLFKSEKHGNIHLNLPRIMQMMKHCDAGETFVVSRQTLKENYDDDKIETKIDADDLAINMVKMENPYNTNEENHKRTALKSTTPYYVNNFSDIRFRLK